MIEPKENNKNKVTSGTKGFIIKSFPDYEITNEGRIWSQKRNKWLTPFENKLKHRPNSQSYLRIGLYDNKGKRRKKMVHRLVAETFILNPDKKPFVNHKNGNKQDNNVKNLEWISNKENCIHASKIGLIEKKLTDKQVKEIRKLPKIIPNKKIAEDYNVSRRFIGMIRNRKRRCHI